MPCKIIPVEVPQGAKWCHGCQSVKAVAAFDKDRRSGDGRCRECRVRRALEYREMMGVFEETHQRLAVRGLGL